MKKTISKITKVLSVFAITVASLFANINIVNADAKESINLGGATLLPGYIAGVRYNIKTVKNGGYAYCLNIHKSTAQNKKANLVKEMDAGVAYILENGYPNKSFTGNKEKDYYITQGAVFWYLDEAADGNNLGNGYKSTGSDNYNLRKYVKKLVSGAKKAKKSGYSLKPSLSLKVSDSNMTLSSDGTYYVSNAIDANAKNITGKYTVKVDSAPSGTIITDTNGNNQTKFKASEKFIVKVPAASVAEGKTETVSIKVGAYKTTNKAYRYQPTDGAMQPVAIITPVTKVKEATIKLTATKEAKPVCKYDTNTNTYYDKSGNVTTKETYIAQCTTPKTCSYDSTFDVYFGKNGNLVTKEVYEDECLPKVCQYDSKKNVYYDNAGNVTTKEIYTDQCLGKSKVTINKLDKSTNNPVSGATLVVKDANKNIIKEFTSTTTGYVITGLSNGTYTVEETKAPAGYKMSTTPVSFTVSETDREVSVSVYNEPVSPIVVINKIDSVTLKNIAGAEILVTNDKGEQVAKFTSTSDSYTIRDLAYGTYTVEELNAPDGYFLNEEKQTFTIDENHLSANVTIKNIPKTCENGGKDENECYVEVPNTGSSETFFSLIGLALTSLGIGYVYKYNKKMSK